MSKASDNFEKQVERIHSLLDGEDSVVTWNDRLPDPDNPSQARQIDVSIRRDDALTLIECRIHAEPQDVKWIEELIGRRTSLNADAVIAVSASGFTRGAILKAKAYGIVLRDIKSLSEDEIRAWGQSTQVSVDFYYFDNVEMRFVFSHSDTDKISLEDVEAAILNRELDLAPLFDRLAQRLRESDPDFPPMQIEGRVTPSGLSVKGRSVTGIDMRTECRREEKAFSIPTVVAYDVPESGALERNTYVKVVELGRFEITQSSDIASIAVDVSAFGLPRNAKLGRMHFRFTRPVEVREFILLAETDLGFWIGPFDLGIDFE